MKKLLYRAIIIIVASFLLTFFFQWRCYGENLDKIMNLVIHHKRIFLYNVAIMFWLVLLISSFFKNAITGIGITWIATVIISYINKCKFDLRATPLIPEDFQLADQTGSLMDFVDWGDVIKTALACILILTVTILLSRLTKNLLVIKTTTKRRIIATALAIVIAVSGLVITSAPVRAANGKKHTSIGFLKMKTYAWNQAKNYDTNGFLVGFLYNLSKFELEEPEGYSKDAITQIAEKYTTKQQDDKNKDLADQDYNIVIVLNESFYDPAIIRKYYKYEGEVTPNLRAIMREYPSGYMYSPEYGGGTANVEYEIATGLSNYWARTVPYTAQIPKLKNQLLALPAWAKTKGYQTTAIHPYVGGMYKRDLVLPREGFDTFITKNEMKDAEHDGESTFVNDRASYNKVLEIINSSDEKQFVGLITMQNHAAYSKEEKDYPTRRWKFDQIDEWWPREQIEIYFETLNYSDKYLGEFINALDRSDEKTVVLFYGDHAPGIFPLVRDSEAQEISDLSHLTPYFVYANFDLKTKKTNLPTTTPNCLTNSMLNVLKVQKPSWYYLLDEVCAEKPILTSVYLGKDELESTDALNAYKLLNYDVLGGKQYWELK